MSVRLLLSFVGGLGLVCSVGGCTGDPNLPKLGKVHGKVTYNGKPLDGGHIVFTPAGGKGGESGQNATGEIDSNGTYDMTTFNTGDGAILGQHVVTVLSREKVEMPKPDANSHIKYELPKSLTPSKYATADKSPLRCTVVPEGTTFDIELKD
ncbi:MAG: hypothetical protein ACLQGP_08810 [Isosphaeraceae bacterium]